MAIDGSGTVLTIKRASDNAELLPDYSARGLTQTLTPIAFGKQFERSVNGRLMNFSHEQFQLYESTISCTEDRPPALDLMYPGLAVTVECACELAYRTGGTAQRSVVSGSSRTEGSFIFYRPSLSMWITDISNSFDEWNAVNGWSIKLEEDQS